MEVLLVKWGLKNKFAPMVFICLGYIKGPYPPAKPRLPDRYLFAADLKD